MGDAGLLITPSWEEPIRVNLELFHDVDLKCITASAYLFVDNLLTYDWLICFLMKWSVPAIMTLIIMIVNEEPHIGVNVQLLIYSDTKQFKFEFIKDDV